MSNDLEQLDQWQPCQGGELTGLAGLQRSAPSSGGRWFGAAAAVLVVCAAAAWAAFGTGEVEEPLARVHRGGMNCRECIGHFDQFHYQISGTQKMADQSLFHHVGWHIEDCKRCQNRYEKKYPGELEHVAMPGGATRSVLLLSQPRFATMATVARW
jgi:hypothetical protein